MPFSMAEPVAPDWSHWPKFDCESVGRRSRLGVFLVFFAGPAHDVVFASVFTIGTERPDVRDALVFAVRRREFVLIVIAPGILGNGRLGDVRAVPLRTGRSR